MTAARIVRLPVIAACLATALLPAADAGAAEPGFISIDLTARTISEFFIGQPQTRFGALEFRGGLDLNSGNRDFGSLSGLDFAADGKTIYAVADSGFWFRARLIENNGRLVGVDAPALAPMLDQDGAPLAGKRYSDAEGLRIVQRNGQEVALVSFEQAASVAAFAPDPDLARARRTAIRLPAFVNSIRRNQGLEAIAVAPPGGSLAGATVVFAERSLDAAGNHRGFILNGPAAGTFALRRIGDFDVTDAAFLPDGDLVVLERHFAFADGLGMRLRRIAGGTIGPGATLDGPVLVEADMHDQIDNMEGLAVRAGENGETLLTLVSDDNHSLLQRTLLLQFAIVPASPPKPELRPTTAR